MHFLIRTNWATNDKCQPDLAWHTGDTVKQVLNMNLFNHPYHFIEQVHEIRCYLIQKVFAYQITIGHAKNGVGPVCLYTVVFEWTESIEL